ASQSGSYHPFASNKEPHDKSFVSVFMMWRPPRPTLFPYTTLFRSEAEEATRLINPPDAIEAAAQTIADAREVFIIGDGLGGGFRSEEHTSELQSRENLVCRRLLEKKNELDTHHRSLYSST